MDTKHILALLALLLSLKASAFDDHRGHNLDSLEQVISSRFTPGHLAGASKTELTDYSQTCRELAWGYLQLDGAKCVYYARAASAFAERLGGDETVFDMSILIGQCFWASEKYDSARVYYLKAEKVLSRMEATWTNPDRHDLEANQSRLWGTLGNFYATQDSVEQFAFYYGKAGTIFEKWGWWEDCSTLHYNLGQYHADIGDYKKARPEYDKALQFALQSGDSLKIAAAMFGLGRWYNETGKTAKALKYLSEAEKYFGGHPREESFAHADTLEVMNAAYEKLYQSARMIAVGAILLLFLALVAIAAAMRLRKTKRELTETSAVLDETIEELRPQEHESFPLLTDQEKAVARLLVEGKSTKEIAEAVHLGVNTVLWYRKRLYAKFDVHSAAAFATAVAKLGLNL